MTGIDEALAEAAAIQTRPAPVGAAEAARTVAPAEEVEAEPEPAEADSWAAMLQEILLWPVAAAAAFAWTLGGAEAQTQPLYATAARSLSAIDWAQAREDAARAGVDEIGPGRGLASFEGAGRAAAGNLQIPVLAPKSLLEANAAGALDEPMTLLARTNEYSLEAKRDGRSVVTTGTRVVFEPPAEATRRVPAAAPLLVERTETGVAASFARYGAVYGVEIYCAAPATDPHCAEETAIRALAAEMTFAP